MRAAGNVRVNGHREHRIVVFSVDPIELIAGRALDRPDLARAARPHYRARPEPSRAADRDLPPAVSAALDGPAAGQQVLPGEESVSVSHRRHRRRANQGNPPLAVGAGHRAPGKEVGFAADLYGAFSVMLFSRSSPPEIRAVIDECRAIIALRPRCVRDLVHSAPTPVCDG
jgi:hypothetical protein